MKTSEVVRRDSSDGATKFNCAFENTDAKQHFQRHHAQANTCLPSTAEGRHPALVLIGQKGLVCNEVCEERRMDTAEALEQIQDTVSTGITYCDVNEDKRIDPTEFRRTLKTVVTNQKEPFLADKEVDVLEELLDLLQSFVPLNKDLMIAEDQKVLKSKLRLVLTLWHLTKRFRDKWLSLCEFPPQKAQLLQVLEELNNGNEVKEREATWVREKYWSIPCDRRLEDTKLLLCIAYWYTAPQARPTAGLNKDQLIKRINLERRLYVGLLKFALWAAVFLLLLYSVIISGALERSRDIRGNLMSQLHLDDATKATTMREVHEFAKEFSTAVTKFAPLSGVYFGGGNTWNLQDGLRAFSRPIALPHLMQPDPNPQGVAPAPLAIGKSFTLQAWVQFEGESLPDEGVSVLRKAHPLDKSLSCWDWRWPPALSYGAHDYGGLGQHPRDLQEEYLYVSEQQSPNPAEDQELLHLHSILVTPEEVTFMVNDRVLSTQALPRPVTDCDSQDLTLGDKGLRLASVRFYPRNLSVIEVKQSFRAGSTWQEIGRVITPQKMQALSEVGQSGNDLSQQLGNMEAITHKVGDASQTASVLSTAAVRDARTPEEIYSNKTHFITPRAADPTLGYPYWEIYGSPVHLDETSKPTADGDALPESRSFTISAWIKFDSNKGTGYLGAVTLPTFSKQEVLAGTTNSPIRRGFDDGCWLIYMGSSYTGWYTRTAQRGKDAPGPTYFVNDLKGPETWLSRGKAYRHYVFQMAPEDPEMPLRVCIDGVCSGEAAIDRYAAFRNESWPPAPSCSMLGTVQMYTPEYRDRVLSNFSEVYLNRRPIDDYTMQASVTQFKYFDRLLTKAEIKLLFEKDPHPDTGKSLLQTEGCRKSGNLRDDRNFRDSFGNGCYWYYNQRKTNPEVCNSQEVKEACAVACEEYEVCWGDENNHQTMQIWRQQMEFRTRGRSGTMCVARSTTPAKEAIKCALNSPDYENCRSLKASGAVVDCGPRNCSAFEFDREGLLNCLNETRWVPKVGSRYDYFVACRDILEQSRDECAWDDTELENISLAMQTSKEWSISFWFQNILDEGCLAPQVRLLDDGGNTFSWLAGISSLVEDRPSGSYWHPGCNTDVWLAHGLIGSEAQGHRGGNDGLQSAEVSLDALEVTPHSSKHLVVISRRRDGSSEVYLNDRHRRQDITEAGNRPILPGKGFLRVINVVGSVRMSPMTLRPSGLTAGDVSSILYSGRAYQDKIIGPKYPLHEQLAKVIPRQPQSYSQKTMVLVPPIILQKRNTAGKCPTLIPIVPSIYSHSLEMQCSSPYDCPGWDENNVYTCPEAEDTSDDGEHFGHPPVTLRQEKFYMEFLASITENSVVVRNEDMADGIQQQQVRKTNDFLDILTREATILALFYSVEFETLSLLRIKFDNSKGRVVAHEKLMHFVAIRGERAKLCIGFLITCLVLLVLIVSDLIPSTNKLYRVYQKSEQLDWGILSITLGDTCLGIVSFLVIILFLLELEDTPQSLKDMVTPIIDFDWQGEFAGEGQLTSVKRDFMAQVQTVQDAFDRREGFEWAATTLGMVLLVRVVYSTSAHPRMELITKTLQLAASDFLHFFALMTIVFMGFAILGTAMFGAERQEFRNAMSAFYTLFDSVVGPPGALPLMATATHTEQIYSLLFHMLGFFFMLNFVLAIIVDAYTTVMKDVRESTVDQDIMRDLVSIIRYQYLLYKHKFKFRKLIIKYLERLDVKVVTQGDLFQNEDIRDEDEIFLDKEAAEAFWNHYRQFTFLTLEEKTEPSMSDLAMIMGITMHKVELMQQKNEDMYHQVELMQHKNEDMYDKVVQKLGLMQQKNEDSLSLESVETAGFNSRQMGSTATPSRSATKLHGSSWAMRNSWHSSREPQGVYKSKETEDSSSKWGCWPEVV